MFNKNIILSVLLSQVTANELVTNNHYSQKNSYFNIDFNDILNYANKFYENANLYTDVIFNKKQKFCYQKSNDYELYCFDEKSCNDKDELVCFNEQENLFEYIEKIEYIKKINNQIQELKDKDIPDYEKNIIKIKNNLNNIWEYIYEPLLYVSGIIGILLLAAVIDQLDENGYITREVREVSFHSQ
tara:strand:+ start:2629 stop:3186 length:558 start_codon:yes stop_codon:yes gene_type:complete